MTLLAIGGLLIGAMLGTRFKVIILYPAILLSCFTLVTLSFAQGRTISETVPQLIIASLALQLGYFIGLIFRSSTRMAQVRDAELLSDLARQR